MREVLVITASAVNSERSLAMKMWARRLLGIGTGQRCPLLRVRAAVHACTALRVAARLLQGLAVLPLCSTQQRLAVPHVGAAHQAIPEASRHRCCSQLCPLKRQVAFVLACEHCAPARDRVTAIKTAHLPHSSVASACERKHQVRASAT
eukprot:1205414-Prymnesium_polylepis.1